MSADREKHATPDEHRIALIGCGAMGSALALGISKEKLATLSLYDRNREKALELGSRTGGDVAEGIRGALASATLAILAVKPPSMPKLLTEMRTVPALSSPRLVVSVAAGVSVRYIEERIGSGWRVARAMPNLACLSCYGVSGIFAADEKDWNDVAALFRTLGEVIPIDDERHLDVVTAVGGAGPAYLFIAMEALIDGATRMGLPREEARRLVTSMVIGSGRLLEESEEHPGVLKDRVASAGGATLAGLYALEERGFRGALMAAIEAGTKRSQEIREWVESVEEE